MKGPHRILVLVVLHVMLAIWSCTDVLSKYAAGADFFSVPFLALWFGVLVLMGVYALGWQQVIRRMPLSTAFANKAITIVWGLFWGVALFGEALTPGKVVGAVLVVAGIVLFVCSEKDATRPQTRPQAGPQTSPKARPESHPKKRPDEDEGEDGGRV